MKQDDLEALTQRYLAASFDEIEDRLALDWQPNGLEIASSLLNERCHELAAALSLADLSSTITLACEMAPAADELSQRKLARRLIESRLTAATAELRAMAGDPLSRPTAPQQTTEVVKESLQVTPKVSEVAAMYAEDRVAQGSWSSRTAGQNTKIFDLI